MQPPLGAARGQPLGSRWGVLPIQAPHIQRRAQALPVSRSHAQELRSAVCVARRTHA